MPNLLLVRCGGWLTSCEQCVRERPHPLHYSCVKSKHPICEHNRKQNENRRKPERRKKVIVSATKSMHHCQRNLQPLKGRFQRGENQLEMRIVPVYIHDGGRTLLKRRSGPVLRPP